MLAFLKKILKKLKDNYIRDWREMDDFQKYGSLVFVLIITWVAFFANKEQQQIAPRYLNFLAIVFVVLMLKRIKRSRRELAEKNKEIEHQKQLIEEHQKETIDSITYAKRLQDAILPRTASIETKFPGSFVLYKPKAIVAGDFYWMEHLNDTCYIAAADCTGHGVPGAMVSVVCSNALNRAVKEFNLSSTGEILDKTTDLVLETFEKSASEVQDGMDISLLSINKATREIHWSGANNPLWYFEGGALREITGDKQPVGRSSHRKPFTTHRISWTTGTLFYLFTDGFADQFGGPKGKKFKYKQFQETLSGILNKDPRSQQQALNTAFETWKGGLEQVDDVCVIGILV
jgi:serine phosphatase RsbU (regulator of sigma subunit)